MRNNMWSIDVQIAGTLYVRAPNAAKALAMAKQALEGGAGLEVEDICSEIAISGLRYSDPDLPAVSLSPAMTVHDLWPGATMELSDD